MGNLGLKIKNLIYLDEIQATPNALQALRYFYEERADIPVIAAGSLLEFALSQHSFSMPVGRVQYLHMGPMTFREFVEACEPDLLAQFGLISFETPLPAHRLTPYRYEYPRRSDMRPMACFADLNRIGEVAQLVEQRTFGDCPAI